MQRSTHTTPGTDAVRAIPMPLPLEDRVEALENELANLRAHVPDSNKACLLVFSGNLDKSLAALIIATTAASMGMEVTIFFTFWGINILKEKRSLQGKDIMEKMLDVMTPAGASGMGVSQMNMVGAGAAMLKHMMKQKNIVSVDELLDLAREGGVKMMVCGMTMQVMNIREEELAEGIEVAGAASYLEDAAHAGLTLFI